jgi:hypothetical protein
VWRCVVDDGEKIIDSKSCYKYSCRLGIFIVGSQVLFNGIWSWISKKMHQKRAHFTRQSQAINICHINIFFNVFWVKTVRKLSSLYLSSIIIKTEVEKLVVYRSSQCPPFLSRIRSCCTLVSSADLLCSLRLFWIGIYALCGVGLCECVAWKPTADREALHTDAGQYMIWSHWRNAQI